MALSVTFVKDNQIYKDAYLKVVKVSVSNTDKEFLENVDDGKIAMRSSWVKYHENFATMYIWADKDSRDRNTQTITAHTFNFDYDLNSDKNAYTQVYEQLKKSKMFESAVDI
jgi:hypothetical protein